MTYVGATPTTGDFKKLDSITTSSATTFNLRQGGVAVYPQSANHCIVSLNGVIQAPIDAFTIVNDTIVFASSLASSDVINFILVLGNVNDIGVVSDDTISAAKIQTDAVSQAKIADEAIDEARMQISNAGSNGQFLSKQSGNTGGLTWADAGIDGWSSNSGNLLPADATKGIYLGVSSATAANLLNDYESGSWNPTWVLGTSGSMTTANASGYWYKVAGFVTVYGYIAFDSGSSPTGTIYIGGLPFTPNAGYGQSSNFHGQGWVSNAWAWGNSSSNGYHPTGINVRTNGLELTSQGVSPSSDSYGGRGYTLDGQTSTMYSSSNYGQVQFGAVYKT